MRTSFIMLSDQSPSAWPYPVETLTDFWFSIPSLVTTLMMACAALVPHNTDPGPRMISIRSTFSSAGT